MEDKIAHYLWECFGSNSIPVDQFRAEAQHIIQLIAPAVAPVVPGCPVCEALEDDPR